MPQQILSDGSEDRRLPVAIPPAALVFAVLWLALACGLPLYQLREARRQGHQDLQRILTTDESQAGRVMAAFDRSNRNLDAAAFGPCIILAFTSLLLVNQMLRLKRRYNAPERHFPVPHRRQRDADSM